VIYLTDWWVVNGLCVPGRLLWLAATSNDRLKANGNGFVMRVARGGQRQFFRSGARSLGLIMRLLALSALLSVLACGTGESVETPEVVLKPTDAAYLEAAVMERSLSLPSKINKHTEIMSVTAIPAGLRYNIRMIHMPAHTVDHQALRVAQVQIAERSCGDERERLELDAGVAMHYVVHGMEKNTAGRFFISDVYCRGRGW